MKLRLFGYGLGLQRPGKKYWRGHKVPFILELWGYTPSSSKVLKTLIGPEFASWAKERYQFAKQEGCWND